MLGAKFERLDNYYLVSTKTVVIIINLRYRLNKFTKYWVNEYYNFYDDIMDIKICRDHCGNI